MRSTSMKWLRSRMLFGLLILLLLVLVLLSADWLCYQVALPMQIDIQGGVATLHVGSQTVPLGSISTPIALGFPAHDPVIHEYQLDGSDSTNNFTLDSTYMHQIATSPYYRFQAWMRDLDGTSRWRNLQIWTNGNLLAETDWPPDSVRIALPASASLSIHVRLQRPETPMTLNLIEAD